MDGETKMAACKVLKNRLASHSGPITNIKKHGPSIALGNEHFVRIN